MIKSAIAIAVTLGLLPQAISAQTVQNSPNASLTVSLNSSAANIPTQGFSELDIKRMDHFSGQALAAIFAFGSETANQNTAIDELRVKVKRLVEAGERCQLTADQTAEYLEFFASQYSQGVIPGVLLDSAGELDAKQLLASVISFYQAATPISVDVDAIEASDLAAIGAVAINSGSPLAVAPEPVEVIVVAEAEIKPLGPVIADDATPAVRAILERVWLEGEDWMIEVKPGDSLGQYATALYGDTLQFSKIFEANRGQLSTPNVITVGQALLLPQNL